MIIIVTLPGEREVTRSSRRGLGTVVKVNEADGSVLKSSVGKKTEKAPLRNEDRIVKLKALI